MRNNYEYIDPDYTLNLNPPDNADVYERYMSGTIEGDVNKLAGLIGELLEREATNEANRLMLVDLLKGCKKSLVYVIIFTLYFAVIA